MGLEGNHSGRRPAASSRLRGRTLLVLGANHRTCPIGDRETLLRRATYPRLRKAAGRPAPWEDLVLLTTCNRIEAYAVTEDPERAATAIASAFGVDRASPLVYLLKGEDAAAHLLRVASGLDSLAQGEGQVTAQVRKAPGLRPASWQQSDVLADLFARAAHAAARVRDLAGLRERDTSASHAAIRYLEAVLPSSRPTVVLLGTGKMARIAAAALKGRATLVVLHRNPAKAREVARTLGGTSGALAQLEGALVRADALIAATASTRPVVTGRLLRSVLPRRDGRPLALVDLGFPRNVDPACRTLPGVTVTDIDGLAPWGHRPLPPAAHARAETRIHADASRLLGGLASESAADIVRFRRAAEDLRRKEVAEALARLPDLTEDQRAVVDKLAARLVNRFLHGPTESLRSLPESTRAQVVQGLVAGLERGGGSA